MNTTHADRQATRRGVSAAAGAFFIWGMLPLYLRPLHAVAALQIASWRYIMGCLFAFAWLGWRGEISKARAALATPAVRWRLLATGALLAVNWTLYAWGVAHGQVLTTSLGYFINPLVNVALGVLVLSERLNPIQWLAIAIAAAGVVLLSINTGELPWIALGLAFSFGFYGLVRKTAAVEALPGLAVETLLMLPLCFLYLLWSEMSNGDVLHHSPGIQVLLVLSGPFTAIPLVLFAYGVRRVNYTTVGMLQYIGPTLQFILGVGLYRETLSPAKLTCFICIWAALLIYAADSIWRARRTRELAN